MSTARAGWRAGSVLLCMSLAPRAQAAGFDPALDAVSLVGAALAVDFENPARLPVTVYDTAGNPVEARAEDDGSTAIEGARSLHLEGVARLVSIDLDPIREGLIGRLIEIRLWQRPRGTRLTGDVRWTVDRVDLGALTIQPTGAVTNDGWEEWTTGPVDFALDGITPRRLLLYDEQYFTSFADLDRMIGVALDAVMVLDLGPARVSSGACRITTETSACGAHGACVFGRCADAAAVLGQPLIDPVLRKEAHARRSFEAHTFEGSRRARGLADGFATFLEWIEAPATPVATYWTTLRTAYDALTDARVSAPLAGSRPDVGGGACAYESDADLLPDAPIAPMIFETTLGHPLADQLRVGDVVRAIDGLAPHAWAHVASRWLSYSGDPQARRTQLAPYLLNAAMVAGAVLSIERCARTPQDLSRCRADEVQRLEIDLAALIAPMIEARELDPIRRRTLCDFRFRRPVREDRSGRTTDYAGYIDLPGKRPIRALQINGVPGDGRWLDLIDRALDAPLPRILLDQRQGNGGALVAAELLASRLVGPRDLERAELWPAIEPTAPRRSGFSACGPMADCGGFVAVDFVPTDPLRGVAAGARVALLDGVDIAGSEFVAQALSMRREGALHIFAPSATMGAFGLVTELTRLPGEVSSITIQTHDTVFLAPGEDHFDLRSGRGVVPTTVLRQRQSDALRGVDTVLEAARVWLEAE